MLKRYPWRSVGLILSTFGPLLGALWFYSSFLEWNEPRSGFAFRDPVLEIIPAYDLSWPIFALIYSALLYSLWGLLKNPSQAKVGVRAYGLLILFRVVALFLLPLDPPESLVVLRDPLVEWFGSGVPLKRDLFFSGHTATLSMLTLLQTTPRSRWIMGVITLLVAMGVLIQHTHYVIDVYCAPFFAFTAFSIAKKKWTRDFS